MFGPSNRAVNLPRLFGFCSTLKPPGSSYNCVANCSKDVGQPENASLMASTKRRTLGALPLFPQANESAPKTLLWFKQAMGP